MTTRFIHLRRRDPFFGHLEPKGGITVAYDIDPAGTVHYTFSQCSNKDHYNKRIGRLVSTGRLQANRNISTFPKVEGVNIVEQIIKHHDETE